MSSSQNPLQFLDGVNYFLRQINLPTLGKVTFGILSDDPFVIVERMCWDDGTGNMRSAIVKHIPWDQFPLESHNELDPAILYETVAYQFLSMIRNEFKYCPKVFNIWPGIIMMEDLGAEKIYYPDELSAQQATLDVLAGMHAASLGKNGLYCSILKKNNIPEDDCRIISHSKRDFNYSNGRETLMIWVQKLGIDNHRWIAELEKAKKLLHDPEPFHCFLHNDFISFRQSAVYDEKLYLLDFERSRFGHALVDVFNLFLGKLEYNNRKRIWFRKYYIPAEGVFEFYQERFEEYCGRHYKEDLWNLHLSSIAACMAVAMIGTLVKAPEHLEEIGINCRPARPFTSDVQQLLQTAIKFVGLHPSYSNLLDLFNELVEKISIISELNSGIPREEISGMN